MKPSWTCLWMPVAPLTKTVFHLLHRPQHAFLQKSWSFSRSFGEKQHLTRTLTPSQTRQLFISYRYVIPWNMWQHCKTSHHIQKKNKEKQSKSRILLGILLILRSEKFAGIFSTTRGEPRREARIIKVLAPWWYRAKATMAPVRGGPVRKMSEGGWLVADNAGRAHACLCTCLCLGRCAARPI